MTTSEEATLSPPLLPSDRLQITDVYEIATKIGVEFQKIIDEYGSPCVTNIIPMIVGALEQLEKVVEENEQFRMDHCKLALQSDRLKEERELRAKMLAEKDEIGTALDYKTRQFEQIQQANYQLQEEAKRLETVLAEQNNSQALESERNKNTALLSNVEELQSALDRANEKLQSSNSLLVEKDKEISRLSTDVDTLCAQLVNYQRRIPSREETRKRADTLDGRDLTVQNEQEPVAEVSESVNEDSWRQAEERIEVLQREKIQMQQEQMVLKKQLAEANEKLALANESSDTVSTSLPTNLTKAGKAPTFYKEDLLCVLEDRDQLGLRVAELEDELKVLRHETKEEPHRRTGSFFFSKQSTPAKPSKVKEIMEERLCRMLEVKLKIDQSIKVIQYSLESLTITVNETAQKTTL